MSQRSPEDPDDVVALLLDAFAAATPPPAALKARVMQRIANAEQGVTTVAASEGAWLEALPGVFARVLFDDQRTRTWLARLEAGARIPAHGHPGDEESYVLEGSCVIAGVELKAGDYQVARAGTSHAEVWSEHGCVLMIRSPSRCAL